MQEEHYKEDSDGEDVIGNCNDLVKYVKDKVIIKSWNLYKRSCNETCSKCSCIKAGKKLIESKEASIIYHLNII